MVLQYLYTEENFTCICCMLTSSHHYSPCRLKTFNIFNGTSAEVLLNISMATYVGDNVYSFPFLVQTPVMLISLFL